MDLETENRIAAILMKEAAELRREAARDGIDAYLCPPIVRGRPNSRFLTATILGVQQYRLYQSHLFDDGRAKHGSCVIGSRMDETGPYLPDSKGKHLGSPNDIGYRESGDNCAIFGPGKPLNMWSNSFPDEESGGAREKRAKRVSSSKHHCRKHRSKERSKDNKKRKKKTISLRLLLF